MALSETFALPSLHNHRIVDVRVDNTCTFLASCALDGTVAVYNLELQQSTHHFELNQTPSRMAWVETMPKFFTIIIGSREGVLHQISLRDDTAASSHQVLGEHEKAVSIISQRGDKLVTTAGSEIVLWTLCRSSDVWTRMYSKIYEHLVQHVDYLDDDKLVLVIGNQQIRFVELRTGQTFSIVNASTRVSGIAVISSQLLLSVSRCCRLTVAKGQPKVGILRSPVLDAKLQSIPDAPLVLAEGHQGDICVWNHRTGAILAVLDAKDVDGRRDFLNVLWNSQYPGLIMTGVAPPQLGMRSGVIIRKIRRAHVSDAVFLPVTLRQSSFKLVKASARHDAIKAYKSSAKQRLRKP